MHIIVPLTKSSYFGGRWGPVGKQDWYQGLAKAKSLLEQNRPAKILIITAVHVAGERSEMRVSLWALKKLGIDRRDIIVIRKAQETIEQIEIAGAYAKEHDAELVFISTFLNYLRVRWLCRGLNAEHRGVFGIPRPKDVFWDTVLTVAFPIVDMCGGREWFVRKTQARRRSGKQ